MSKGKSWYCFKLCIICKKISDNFKRVIIIVLVVTTKNKVSGCNSSCVCSDSISNIIKLFSGIVAIGGDRVNSLEPVYKLGES